MVVVALVLIVVFRYSPYELAAHTDDPAFDYETAMVHHVRAFLLFIGGVAVFIMKLVVRHYNARPR